jgi:hypothetical protein
MTKDFLDYESMVEDALRGVARAALRQASEHGLDGKHHFYISFRTDAPGVDIADNLRREYPSEMSIALQNQYWDLEVTEDRFSVMLNFHKLPHRLEFPFAALTGFADPGVNFALQFGPRPGPVDDAEPARADTPVETAGEAAATPVDAEKVVTLDAFRKK